MLSLVLCAFLSSPVLATADGSRLRRQFPANSSVPMQCDMMCTPLNNDLLPCYSGPTTTTDVQLLGCLCTTQAQNDFVDCATCYTGLLTALNATSVQQVLQEIQAFCDSRTSSISGGGTGTVTSSQPEPTSTECCEAWATDVQPCQASGDYQPCTCTSATEQDFLACMQCNAAVLAEFNTTDPNVALQILQEYCDLPSASATLSSAGNSSSGSSSNPFAGLPLGTSGSGSNNGSGSGSNPLSGLPGTGGNAAPATRPVLGAAILATVAVAAVLL